MRVVVMPALRWMSHMQADWRELSACDCIRRAVVGSWSESAGSSSRWLAASRFCANLIVGSSSAHEWSAGSSGSHSALTADGAVDGSMQPVVGSQQLQLHPAL